MNKMIRNKDRLLFFDKILTQNLWLKIKGFVPDSFGNNKAIGLSEMFKSTDIFVVNTV